MGDIADQMIDGEACQVCLMPFPAALGYPASCLECGGVEPHGPPPGTKCGKCKGSNVVTRWENKGSVFLEWYCIDCKEPRP